MRPGHFNRIKARDEADDPNERPAQIALDRLHLIDEVEHLQRVVADLETMLNIR